MSHLPFHQQQLSFMTDLASHRPEFLNPFFVFLNYFDSVYFFFVLIPIVWLGISYRWGLRIYYWYTLNFLINSLAKHLFGWPRPSTDVFEIGLLHPTSPGFPSGGAQTCFLLGALLIYYWKTAAAWIIGLIYILLISFSRLYLGVHYPLDVLGGWAIAIVLFFIFIKTKDPIDHLLHKIGLNGSFLLSIFLPVLLAIAVPTPRMFYILGSALGIGFGAYISLRKGLFLPDSKNIKEAAIRSCLGILMLFLVVMLWPFRTPSQSFAAAFFMSTFASPICKWIFAKMR